MSFSPNALKLVYRKLLHYLRSPVKRAEDNAMLLGGLRLENILRKVKVENLREVELQVFSQWGEDGIIQYLINSIPIEQDIFVEFGVEDYREANTRFLLRNNNWRGLVIDGNPMNIESIRDERISVYHDLQSLCSFVTAENINVLISSAGISGDIGLLSIDIDGNDYWVWRAIDAVSPRIVVCEYNSLFGPDIAVTVPYDPKFDYNTAHYSRLYFGASLAALCRLADEKGYAFAGCTSAGNDAFFVRNDVAQHVKTFTAREGYVECRFRDSRGPDGEKTFLAGDERLRVIEHLNVYDLLTGTVMPLRDALRRQPS